MTTLSKLHGSLVRAVGQPGVSCMPVSSKTYSNSLARNVGQPGANSMLVSSKTYGSLAVGYSTIVL